MSDVAAPTNVDPLEECLGIACVTRSLDAIAGVSLARTVRGGAATELPSPVIEECLKFALPAVQRGFARSQPLAPRTNGRPFVGAAVRVVESRPLGAFDGNPLDRPIGSLVGERLESFRGEDIHLDINERMATSEEKEARNRNVEHTPCSDSKVESEPLSILGKLKVAFAVFNNVKPIFNALVIDIIRTVLIFANPYMMCTMVASMQPYFLAIGMPGVPQEPIICEPPLKDQVAQKNQTWMMIRQILAYAMYMTATKPVFRFWMFTRCYRRIRPELKDWKVALSLAAKADTWLALEAADRTYAMSLIEEGKLDDMNKIHWCFRCRCWLWGCCCRFCCRDRDLTRILLDAGIEDNGGCCCTADERHAALTMWNLFGPARRRGRRFGPCRKWASFLWLNWNPGLPCCCSSWQFTDRTAPIWPWWSSRLIKANLWGVILDIVFFLAIADWHCDAGASFRTTYISGGEGLDDTAEDECFCGGNSDIVLDYHCRDDRGIDNEQDCLSNGHMWEALTCSMLNTYLGKQCQADWYNDAAKQWLLEVCCEGNQVPAPMPASPPSEHECFCGGSSDVVVNYYCTDDSGIENEQECVSNGHMWEGRTCAMLNDFLGKECQAEWYNDDAKQRLLEVCCERGQVPAPMPASPPSEHECFCGGSSDVVVNYYCTDDSGIDNEQECVSNGHMWVGRTCAMFNNFLGKQCQAEWYNDDAKQRLLEVCCEGEQVPMPTMSASPTSEHECFCGESSDVILDYHCKDDGGIDNEQECVSNGHIWEGRTCSLFKMYLGEECNADWFNDDVKQWLEGQCCIATDRETPECHCLQSWDDSRLDANCTQQHGCPAVSCTSAVSRRWCHVVQYPCIGAVSITGSGTRMYCNDDTPVMQTSAQEHDGSKCADDGRDCCASKIWEEAQACDDGYIPMPDEECDYTSNENCHEYEGGAGCYGCFEAALDRQIRSNLCSGGSIVREANFTDLTTQQMVNCGQLADSCSMYPAECGGIDLLDKFLWESTDCCSKVEDAEEEKEKRRCAQNASCEDTSEKRRCDHDSSCEDNSTGNICAGGYLAPQASYWDPNTQKETNCGQMASYCTGNAACGDLALLNDFLWQHTECCSEDEILHAETECVDGFEYAEGYKKATGLGSVVHRPCEEIAWLCSRSDGRCPCLGLDCSYCCSPPLPEITGCYWRAAGGCPQLEIFDSGWHEDEFHPIELQSASPEVACYSEAKFYYYTEICQQVSIEIFFQYGEGLSICWADRALFVDALLTIPMILINVFLLRRIKSLWDFSRGGQVDNLWADDGHRFWRAWVRSVEPVSWQKPINLWYAYGAQLGRENSFSMGAE